MYNNSIMVKQQQYSLWTALAMIVWIVIGSGIFFKADNVLAYTQGNIGLGILIFTIAAFAIVFGSLSVAELAKRTDKPWWIISYAHECIGPRTATMIGWFQILLYYPTLTAIISRVVGIYITLAFGIDASLELQIWIGLGWMIICYGFNLISWRFGGKFQEVTTIVKLIPLFVLGIGAFIYGDPVSAITHPSGAALDATKSLGWLAAVGPIAFAFDGWVISTAVGHKIKNSLRNLPLALTLAPLAILIIYIIYFTGISSYLGAEKVIALGDGSVEAVAVWLFNPTIAKAFLVFVVMSVMGTLNGLILGFIQLPYSLAIRKFIPLQKIFSQVNTKFNMPIYSWILSFGITLFWLLLHYIAMKTGILWGMDISEISIVVSYLLYIVLYYQVFKFRRQGKIKSIFFGLISPIFATMGSGFILFGGMQNTMFLTVCLPICLGVLWIAYRYAKKYEKPEDTLIN